MHVEVSTDNQIQGSDELAAAVRGTVEAGLARFGPRLTRVEVHQSDECSAVKTHGTPIRCRLEARPNGQPPVAVSADAGTWGQAVGGAVDKMTRLLDSHFGRLSDGKGRTPAGGDPRI